MAVGLGAQEDQSGREDYRRATEKRRLGSTGCEGGEGRAVTTTRGDGGGDGTQEGTLPSLRQRGTAPALRPGPSQGWPSQSAQRLCSRRAQGPVRPRL